MEQRQNEISDLPRFSAGKAVFILIKQIKELSSALSPVLSNSALANLNEFLSQYPQNSVLTILNSIAKSSDLSQSFTILDSSPILKITHEVLDNYFSISDYIKSIADLNQLIIFQLETLQNFLEYFEFLDSKIESEHCTYSLSGIVVKKNNMFGVITKDISGLIYNKLYSSEKFETWGEALYSACEGDFLPCFVVYVKKTKYEDQDEYIFMQESTMELIRSMHIHWNFRIKSVTNNGKTPIFVQNPDLLEDPELIPNEENVMRVLLNISNS